MNGIDDQTSRFLNFLMADIAVDESDGDETPSETFFITQEDGFLIELEDSGGYLLQEIAP